jgi:hypothetical protein
MTTNLARLDYAHAALAAMYPGQVPTRTTCGDVTSPLPRSEAEPLFANHRWRLRWLRNSWAARRARSVTGSRNVVLADIRCDIDGVLARSQTSQLRLLNLFPEGKAFPDPDAGTTQLRRGAVFIVCSTVTTAELAGRRLDDRPTLVTNLDAAALAQVTVGPDDIIGVHESLGYWLITGVVADPDEIWSSRRARPSSLLV